MTPEQIYDFAKYVRKEEQERIISLLEKLRNSEYSDVMTHDEVVAFIKGEN